MKSILKNVLHPFGIIPIVILFLAGACNQEEVEPSLPENKDNSVMLLPRSGNAFPDVIINLSEIDWTQSNVFRAFYDHTLVAEICKEYLYMPDLIDSAAIVVYLADPATGKANLSQGFVAQVYHLNTGKADIKQIHGGTVAFSLIGDSTVCHYVPGHSSAKTVVHITGQTRSSIASFEETTLLPYFLEDYDHNRYGTVKIGLQYWQRENLQTTHYADGTFIDSYNWENAPYGRLYAFPIVQDKIFLPGWGIPSEKEWEQLVKYLNSDKAGYKMKSTSGWRQIFPTKNFNGNNISGFNALPGGWYEGESGIIDQNITAYWWSIEGKARYLFYTRETCLSTTASEQYGMSIRCIRK